MTKLSRTALDLIETDAGFAAALAVVLGRPFGAGRTADAQTGTAAIAAMVVAIYAAAFLLERRPPRWRRSGKVERSWAVFLAGVAAGTVALGVGEVLTGFAGPMYAVPAVALLVTLNVWIALGAVRTVSTQPGR